MTRHAEHLILARHGRAEHNEIKHFMTEERLASLPEAVLAREVDHHPLTEEGVEQAKALGAWVADHLIAQEGTVPNRFYVSPTTRTMQTAGYTGLAIEAAHPSVPVQWIRDRNLRETHRGNIEQLRRLPGYDRSAEPQLILPPNELYRREDGGESLQETIERWNAFRQQRRLELSGSIGLIVTHGYFMGGVELAMEADGMDDADALALFHERSPANCNVVQYTNVEPETGDVADAIRWVRAVVPYETDKGFSFEWREIGRTCVSSSAELIEAGNRYERLIEPLRQPEYS